MDPKVLASPDIVFISPRIADSKLLFPAPTCLIDQSIIYGRRARQRTLPTIAVSFPLGIFTSSAETTTLLASHAKAAFWITIAQSDSAFSYRLGSGSSPRVTNFYSRSKRKHLNISVS